MSALEEFVTKVHNMSLAHGCFSALAEYIRKAIDEVLKNVSHLEQVLQTFDVNQHSLGILAVLYVRVISFSNTTAIDCLLAQVQEFLAGCNVTQIRYLPDIYADLFHRISDILISKNQASRGISILSRAIERFQKAPSELTLVHADLCMLCLHAKNLKPALKFLDTDIVEISKEHCTHFDAKYFLLYYYYGGLIYTALKKFDRALHFFEVAVSTPAQAVSHIMVDAYKKFIIVSLISRGKVMSLPKYTSSVVSRFIRTLCQAYLDLVDSYMSNSPDALRECVVKRSEVFNRDKNMGLVKQVVNSVYKRNIHRLTKTFLTLSLADVANRCNLTSAAEAEKYIVAMIEDGDIYAAINQKDGMVYFHDAPEKYNTADVVKMIDDEIAESIELSQLVRKLDVEYLLNPQYVQKVVKSSASSVLHEDEGVSIGKDFSDL